MNPARQKVIELRRSEPRLTLLAIGQRCNITKQRVFSILRSENLPTKSLKKKFTTCCVCYNIIELPKKICKHCKEKYYYTILKCDYCQKDIQIRKKLLKVREREGYKHIYCNRACFLISRRADLKEQYNYKK